jgi:pyridoxamine 5'-phosphate oxidase
MTRPSPDPNWLDEPLPDEMQQLEPLRLLEQWLTEVGTAGVGEPGAGAFVTVGQDGRPSARTVLLKRLEHGALVFTSALWTRKAREIEANPNVALLFYWPTIARQVHITGLAVMAERELALEMFSQRERSHQVQTLVSRQGEPIEDIAALRARHAHLMEAMESRPSAPRIGCHPRPSRDGRVLEPGPRPHARQAAISARRRWGGAPRAWRRERVAVLRGAPARVPYL